MKCISVIFAAAAVMLSLFGCGAKSAVTAPAEPKSVELDYASLTAETAAETALDIYLLAGQSNASGSTRIATAGEGERDANTYRNVWYYYSRQDVDGTNQASRMDYRPVTEGLGYDEEHIGPELGMARVLNEKYTGSRKALILKVAAGGTSLLMNERTMSNWGQSGQKYFLQRGSWYPSSLKDGEPMDSVSPTGFLTRQLRRTIDTVYRELLEKGFLPENIRFKALCWMQGEEDRSHTRNYYTYFPAFAEEIRGQITETTGTDHSAMPVIMGEISESFSSASRDSLETNRKFNDVLHRLADENPSFTVIPTGQYQLTELVDGSPWSLVRTITTGITAICLPSASCSAIRRTPPGIDAAGLKIGGGCGTITQKRRRSFAARSRNRSVSYA